MTNKRDVDRLLSPGQVAWLFRVDPKTVTRWAQAGKLTPIRTIGGHRRYRETEIMRHLLSDGTVKPVEAEKMISTALATVRR